MNSANLMKSMRKALAHWLLAIVIAAIALPICASETNVPTEYRVSGLPPRSTIHTRIQPPSLPPPALTIHVSPRGHDTGDGTVEKPFATLEQAQQQIHRLKQKAPMQKGGIAVLAHGGEYTVTSTFVLAPEDSGNETAPIRFQAAPGENPVFRGGIRLQGWRRVSETTQFSRLPLATRSNVWYVDLKDNGVANLLPLKLGGYASGHGFKTHPAHELFFNGRAMQLARGPNNGFLRVTDVAVQDGTKGYDRRGSKIGKIHYEDGRPSAWVGEPELLLYGYWFWDWADSYERVASIDPEKRLITLAEPWHNYGFSVGAPFYAVNALSELDAPGEWYLDRSGGHALLFPPSNPAAASIELSLFPAPMVELDNVSHVAFEGLTWELGSADAIRVRGGAHCLFAGCTIRNFAGNGIQIQGGMKHGLISCDIYSMGRGGAVVAGGHRKTLAPGEHFIENCDIHDLSRIDHTYTPCVLLEGVGNRLAHNRFHDVLSSAMRIEGNNHIIEYNEVYNVVTESDDQGAVDMFGNPTYRGNIYRFNYWHHTGNWRALGEQPKCGQAGIRLDDAICGTLIYGNVFERCSTGKRGFGAVQIHGGKENVVDNNLFVDCAAVVSFSPWSEERWRDSVKSALDHPAIDRELYLKRYPDLANLEENPNVNHIRRNLALRCAELLRHAPKTIKAEGNTMRAEGEFTIMNCSPLLKQASLDPIPVDEIGLYTDAWRK